MTENATLEVNAVLECLFVNHELKHIVVYPSGYQLKDYSVVLQSETQEMDNGDHESSN